MDLVERYLQAVRFWLPRANQDDITAELAEDLRCRQEDREARLGRPLGEAETAALLAEVGNPLQVASQYLQQKPWLDPALSMIFRFVVKLVLLWILVPLYAVVAVPAALLSQRPLEAMAGSLGSFAFSELVALGCITLVFALVGSSGKYPGRSWDPLRLPPLQARGPRPLPRSGSFAELVFGLLFAAWWVEGCRRLPLAWSSHLGPLGAGGPLWTSFHAQWFWPVLAVTLAGCAVAAVCLARPHLVAFRLGYGILADTFAAAICTATILPRRPDVLAALHNLSNLAHGGSDLAGAVDSLVALLLVLAAVGSVCSAFTRIARLLLLRRSFTGGSTPPRS